MPEGFTVEQAGAPVVPPIETFAQPTGSVALSGVQTGEGAQQKADFYGGDSTPGSAPDSGEFNSSI